MSIKETIKIPEDVEITLIDSSIVISGKNGQLKRDFRYPNITIKKENSSIVISSEKDTKREKRVIGTFKAHMNNLISGIKEGFEYKLKICSSHFPMHVSVQDDFVFIKNFLGEKVPRKAKILEGVKVNIDHDIVTVTGIDIEKVSQTAANIEKATRRPGFDPRVFQDGIYITNKAGKIIK